MSWKSEMNRNGKSITVWIIDDDEINRRHHKLSFLENRPDIRVVVFECLHDAFQRDPHPDFIFIDLGAVDGRTTPCSDNNSYIGTLQRFVEKHDSAFTIIMGAATLDAKEDVKDLRNACPDIRLFALDSCGRKNLDALVGFVNKYS